MCQADVGYMQPQFIGNAKHPLSTLWWTHGQRQPWDAQAAQAFAELRQEGAEQMAQEAAEWAAHPRGSKKRKKSQAASSSAAPPEEQG